MTAANVPEGWGYIRGEELARMEADLTALLDALDGIAYAEHTEAERDRLRDKAQGLLTLVRDAREYLTRFPADPPENPQ